ARRGAGNAHRITGLEGLGVVVRVVREARVGAAVGSARAAGAELDAVARGGVVEPHHDAGGGIVRIAVQPVVALGVVDVGDVAANGLDALLEEHITGDDVAATGAVGGDRGQSAVARRVARVEPGQTAL